MVYRAKLNISIITALCLLMFFSCNLEPPSNRTDPIFESIKTTDISSIFANTKNEFKLSLFSRGIEYIPFEEPISIYNVIKLVKKSNNLICIVDRNFNIIIFNKSGRPLRRIGSRGKGPGEFLDICSIDLDSSQDLLVIKELSGKKIIRYKISDGTLISEFNDPEIYAGDCKILKNGKILLFVPSPQYYYHMHSFWILDENNEVEQKLWKRSDKMSELMKTILILNFYVYPVENGFDIWSARLNGIVHLDTSNLMLTPKLSYHFDSNAEITPEFTPKDLKNMADELCTTFECFPLGNIYFFNFSCKSDVIYGFYDIESQNAGKLGNIFSYSGFIDDIDNGPKFLPKGIIERGVAYDFITTDEYMKIKRQEVARVSLTKEQLIERNTIQDVLRLVYFE